MNNDDWQVGDLALKITGGKMSSGVIARVIGIRQELRPSTNGDMNDLSIGLVLDGWPAPEGAWHAGHFRKIKPDAEPCEEEFTTLIKRGARKPVRVLDGNVWADRGLEVGA